MKPVAKQFSFIGHPARILLQRALEFVHGIEKIDLICFDHTTASLQGATGTIENNKKIISPLTVDLNARIGTINKEREKEPDFEWFENKMLPYQISEKNGKTRNLFNETEMIVLLVRIPNHYDGKKDLLFLFFDKEMRSFGLNKGDKELSATVKTLFEKTYVKLLIMYAGEIYTDQEILATIGENVAGSGKYIEQQNQKIREEKEKVQDLLEEAANYFLEHFGRLHHRNYFFTEGAMAYIKKFPGKFIQLREVVGSAVGLVNNLTIFEPKSAIPINEACLNFGIAEETETQKATPIEHSHFSNAARFLDRLENAAISVKLRNMPLTSENVANSHDIPVKPPAISYGMKYHHKKIIYLLNNYPDKWTTIRNDFKPLLNIIEKDPENDTGQNKNTG